MRISVSAAKGRLTDLVRRAEGGDEVILTRHGRPAARLVGLRRIPTDPGERRAIIERIVRQAKSKWRGVDPVRSQDVLYDEETGLPR